MSDLPDLIFFGLPIPIRLQVNDFSNIWKRKNMVAAFNSLFESQISQHAAKGVETNVCVGIASKNQMFCVFASAHSRLWERFVAFSPLLVNQDYRFFMVQT
jgi:hypothetical protein